MSDYRQEKEMPDEQRGNPWVKIKDELDVQHGAYKIFPEFDQLLHQTAIDLLKFLSKRDDETLSTDQIKEAISKIIEDFKNLCCFSGSNNILEIVEKTLKFCRKFDPGVVKNKLFDQSDSAGLSEKVQKVIKNRRQKIQNTPDVVLPKLIKKIKEEIKKAVKNEVLQIVIFEIKEISDLRELSALLRAKTTEIEFIEGYKSQFLIKNELVVQFVRFLLKRLGEIINLSANSK